MRLEHPRRVTGEWSHGLAAALADLARDNADTAAALQRLTSFQV